VILLLHSGDVHLITGWEWIVVLLVVVALLVWGPQKIPELARALGKVRGEFDKAQKEFEAASREYAKPTPEKPAASSEDILIDTAQKLGISTEGKTKEQISQEIVQKTKARETTDNPKP